MLQWTIKEEDEMEIICGNYISSAAEKGSDSDTPSELNFPSLIAKSLLYAFSAVLHNNSFRLLMLRTLLSSTKLRAITQKTLINSKALDELSTFRRHSVYDVFQAPALCILYAVMMLTETP